MRMKASKDDIYILEYKLMQKWSWYQRGTAHHLIVVSKFPVRPEESKIFFKCYSNIYFNYLLRDIYRCKLRLRSTIPLLFVFFTHMTAFINPYWALQNLPVRHIPFRMSTDWQTSTGSLRIMLFTLGTHAALQYWLATRPLSRTPGSARVDVKPWIYCNITGKITKPKQLKFISNTSVYFKRVFYNWRAFASRHHQTWRNHYVAVYWWCPWCKRMPAA